MEPRKSSNKNSATRTENKFYGENIIYCKNKFPDSTSNSNLPLEHSLTLQNMNILSLSSRPSRPERRQSFWECRPRR